MTPTAIVLVVISAFVHASWNLLSKRARPSAAFFLVANMAGAVALSPVVFLYWDTLTTGIPERVWWLLLAAGFFMAIYYSSLAGAYRTGEMSVAYPLARSSPVIVVLVVTILLGRQDQVSAQCVTGIALVASGCFLVPLERFGDLHFRNYLNATCGFALLAGVGTAGYSIVDDEALRALRTDPDIIIDATRVTVLYGCLEAVAAFIGLAFLVAVRRRGRSELVEVVRNGKRQAVLTGVAIYVTYTIVLISLAHVNNVSYVVGLRQLSIPLGAAFGILILKEPAHRPKLAGVATMFLGLVLVASG